MRFLDLEPKFVRVATPRYIYENQVIVAEDLNIKGMVKNRSLSRAISDAGWSILLQMIAYKSDWYGRTFLKVDRFYPSSKTCSKCGTILEKLPLGVRNWTCPECGAVHDRDINASKNILAAGLAVARKSEVCGSDVSHCIIRSIMRSEMKQKTSSASLGIPSL